MVLRDMTIAGRLPPLPDLAYAYGGLVYPVGGSIHRFLAERYGEWRILELYNDIWKYSGFESALLGVYGRTIEQLSEEWQYWSRQHYYPAVSSQPPLAITARKLTELAIKPTAFQLPGDTAPSFLFFSPRSGYTTIYAEDLAGRGRRAVVQGERNEQFESFHFFESRIDVSPLGIAAFSSKYGELGRGNRRVFLRPNAVRDNRRAQSLRPRSRQRRDPLPDVWRLARRGAALGRRSHLLRLGPRWHVPGVFDRPPGDRPPRDPHPERRVRSPMGCGRGGGGGGGTGRRTAVWGL